MEITGKIIWAGEYRSGLSASTQQQWASQDFVIESHIDTPTGAVMTQRVCFNVFGADKIAEYALAVGKNVTVHYSVNAREYQGKWYNDVRAHKVEIPVVNQPVQTQQMMQNTQPAQQQTHQQPTTQQAAPQTYQQPAQQQTYQQPTAQTNNDGLPF